MAPYVGQLPGLPSGKGTEQNPIAVPGVEAKANDGSLTVLIIVGLLLLLLAALDEG